VRAESGAQGLKFGRIADGRVRLLADPCERAVLSAVDAASRGGVDPGANFGLAEGSLKLFGGRRRGRIAAAIVSAFCGPWVARRSGRNSTAPEWYGKKSATLFVGSSMRMRTRFSGDIFPLTTESRFAGCSAT
jgi:hypothetical protein